MLKILTLIIVSLFIEFSLQCQSLLIQLEDDVTDAYAENPIALNDGSFLLKILEIQQGINPILTFRQTRFVKINPFGEIINQAFFDSTYFSIFEEHEGKFRAFGLRYIDDFPINMRIIEFDENLSLLRDTIYIDGNRDAPQRITNTDSSTIILSRHQRPDSLEFFMSLREINTDWEILRDTFLIYFPAANGRWCFIDLAESDDVQVIMNDISFINKSSWDQYYTAPTALGYVGWDLVKSQLVISDSTYIILGLDWNPPQFPTSIDSIDVSILKFNLAAEIIDTAFIGTPFVKDDIGDWNAVKFDDESFIVGGAYRKYDTTLTYCQSQGKLWLFNVSSADLSINWQWEYEVEGDYRVEEIQKLDDDRILFSGSVCRGLSNGLDTRDAFLYVFDSINTDVPQLSIEHEFGIFPNPSSGIINLRCDYSIEEVTIFDLQGRLVRMENFIPNKKLKLDVSELENGMFIVKVKTEKGVMNRSVVITN